MIKQKLLIFLLGLTFYNCGAQQVFGTGIEFGPVLKDNNTVWQITSVKKGSSAWYAGFMPGDVIRKIRINGQSKTIGNEKAELTAYLTGEFNEEIEIGISRTDEPDAPVLYAYARCSSGLAISSDKNGICISGDCMNGKGDYIDAAGNIWSGTFVNGKLNGADGEVLMGDGFYAYSGNFVDGMKSGYGMIQYGQRQITSVSTANGYFGNFKNDQPDGKGHIALLNGNTYSAEYENGKMKGYVKYTFNNGDYCFCDAADEFKPVECYNSGGDVIGMLVIPE